MMVDGTVGPKAASTAVWWVDLTDVEMAVKRAALTVATMAVTTAS